MQYIRTFFIVILLVFLYSFESYAQSLQVQTAPQSLKELESGASVNALMTFVNNGNSDEIVYLKFKEQSDGWRFISDYTAIVIPKNSTVRKIIGFKIQNNIRSGKYTVNVVAFNKKNEETLAEISFPIEVKPKFDLAIVKLKFPEYVFIGDTIRISYLLQNLSNTDIKVKALFYKGSDSKEKLFSIPKDSSLLTVFEEKVSGTVESYTKQSVLLVSQIVEKPDVEITEYTGVEIFPTKALKFDKWERLPLRITAISALSNRTEGLLSSTMFDISGSGSIGNTNRSLEFHIRGPNQVGNPLFGLNDEYTFKYKSPKLSVSLGDNSFGLSELTESSRGGRGVELNYGNKKWIVGSYYVLPRYYPALKHVMALYSNIDFNANNKLQFGVLSKVDTSNQATNLLSLSGKTTFLKYFETEGEYAMSQYGQATSKAFKANLNLNTSFLNAHVAYLKADPDFMGYMNNSIRLSSNIVLKIKRLNLSFSYDINSTNMALDTLMLNMPYSKSLFASLGFRLNNDMSLSVSANQSTTQDRSPIPLFDYQKTSGRFAWTYRKSGFGVQLSGDAGKMNNFLQNSLNPSATTGESRYLNGSINLNAKLGKLLNIGAFSSYQGGVRNVTGYDVLYYGGSFSSKMGESLSMMLQYNSNFEWQYYNSDRNLFSTSIHYRINQKNELSVTGNYNLVKNTLDKKEYNIQLRYTRVLHVAVAKKKDIGSITGKILNQGVKSIEGIRLNLNGLVAITDKNGVFKFSSVPVGSYILKVDVSSLGINVMTNSTEPLSVVVEAGKVSSMEFGLITSSKVTGKLVIEEDERSNQKGFIPVKESVERLIVELSRGSRILRLYTDKDGAFRFTDLLPGEWQLKVYPKGLPSGYIMEKSVFQLDLKSGETQNVDVLIKKRARQIQFQSISK